MITGQRHLALALLACLLILAGTAWPAPPAPPRWAAKARDLLKAWHSAVRQEAVELINSPLTYRLPGNRGKMLRYYGGLDSNAESMPRNTALLTIVRDPLVLELCRRVSDHLWENLANGASVDWNESHHGGELTWASPGLTVVDYDNPKWIRRCLLMSNHLTKWTGITDGHRHFRSFHFKGSTDEWREDQQRGAENPEDRRFTRCLTYCVWHDPKMKLDNGQTVADFMRELDTAMLEDALKTDLGKPPGVVPGEIRFSDHRIGGYSGHWWEMGGGLDGYKWDWRVGFVQSRDAYYQLLDEYLATGDRRFLKPVELTIKYFSVDQAINGIPPQYMYDDLGRWPDNNNPWGGYQYLINDLYRRISGDRQFDRHFLLHARNLWKHLPPSGQPRRDRMIRSKLEWDQSSNQGRASAAGPFFLAWRITGDKEWLCRALDELQPDVQGQPWLTNIYTGSMTVALNRWPDQPITWEDTSSDFAALVLSWDRTHLKLLAYNFEPRNRPVKLVLWQLQPGRYVLRHGPDANQDDRMDRQAGRKVFTCRGRHSKLSITLPAQRLEVFEISPAVDRR